MLIVSSAMLSKTLNPSLNRNKLVVMASSNPAALRAANKLALDLNVKENVYIPSFIS